MNNKNTAYLLKQQKLLNLENLVKEYETLEKIAKDVQESLLISEYEKYSGYVLFAQYKLDQDEINNAHRVYNYENSAQGKREIAEYEEKKLKEKLDTEFKTETSFMEKLRNRNRIKCY